MKKLLSCVMALLAVTLFPLQVWAVGEGNVDHGGGGMGSGSSSYFWNPGNDGVRVSVVRVTNGAEVIRTFDMTDISLPDVVCHFGIHSKLEYRDGLTLTPQAGNYRAVKPTVGIPKIISSASGAASIEEIKRYFCSEYAVQLVANVTGIAYDLLISGEYKLLLEPIAYMTLGGSFFALTAHQTALYDQTLSGGVRAHMVSLSHKNLPLAMFLEHADMGYPAWTGTTTQAVSNDTILQYLGLGIVRFTEDEIFQGDSDMGDGSLRGGTDTVAYTYRTDTDVITAIQIDAAREYNPDNPLTARFTINGENYLVKDIVVPDGESQIVWVKWHTPPEPQDIVIRAVIGGRSQTLLARIEEIIESEPPDPKADDRNDAFTPPAIPDEPESETLSWGVWSADWHIYWVWQSDWVWNGSVWNDNGQWLDLGWYDFTFQRYQASMTVNQVIGPNEYVPTAGAALMKSGYGFYTNVLAKVETDAPQTAYTQPQTALMHFPEFAYQTYFRVLDRTMQTYQTRFAFKGNRYSTYGSRAHFTPIWYPDGEYMTYTQIYDAWTPAGMLRINQTEKIQIVGNLFDDWHIAPQKN